MLATQAGQTSLMGCVVQDFKNRGTWDSIYIDPDFRAFRTNKKNIFVLKRMA